MLVLHTLRCAVVRVRIDELGHEVHLGNLLQNHCVVNSLCRILTPGERAMVLAEHSRNIYRVFALERLYNDKTGVLLIAFLDLLCG